MSKVDIYSIPKHDKNFIMVLFPFNLLLYVLPTILISVPVAVTEKIIPELSIIKQPIFMFMDFVGQKFRQGTEGIGLCLLYNVWCFSCKTQRLGTGMT